MLQEEWTLLHPTAWQAAGQHLTENITAEEDQLIEHFLTNYPVQSWMDTGLFELEYIRAINSHWLQFPPPSPVSHYLLAALYVIIMCVGMFGNSLVVVMLISCRSLRTPGNMLVVNLAVSDFFMIAKTPVFIYNSVKLGPALGRLGCEIYGFVGGLTGTVSIATLAAIAVDRYQVILYPMDPDRRTTRVRAAVCVCLAWVYGAVFASLPLFGINQYVPEGYLTSCSFDYLAEDTMSRTFIIVFFVAAWVIPFSIITFCYVHICAMVYHVRRTGGLGPHRQQYKKTELKLTMVVVGIITLWFCAWTPYAIVALLGVSSRADLISPLTSMIPALFCKMASCLDPFVYAVTHPRFRKELLRCCCGTKVVKVRAEKAIKSRVTTAAVAMEIQTMQNGESSIQNDDMSLEQLRRDGINSEPYWIQTGGGRHEQNWFANSNLFATSNYIRPPLSF